MIVDMQGVSPTPAGLHHMECDLLAQTNGYAAVWFGRGSTALYYAFEASKRGAGGHSKGEILIPATACSCIANMACLAGMAPRFLDIDPMTGFAALNALQTRHSHQMKAFVYIHLYGGCADLSTFQRYCAAHGMLLIEDAAQAIGAHASDGGPAGRAGDFVLYSFGRSKMFDTGGALLIARAPYLLDALLEAIEARPLPAMHPCRRAELAIGYRDLQRALLAQYHNVGQTDLPATFARLRPQYDSLYLEPFIFSERLPAMWPMLNTYLERRMEKAARYHSILESGPWRIIDTWRESGACWRYSLLLDDGGLSVKMAEALRREGFNASNLFWPLNVLFQPEDACPAAEDFGRRILNLWVDETVDVVHVEACARSLRALALNR